MGREHMMIWSFEAQQNITYDIEIVRHFEVIPTEECYMETRSVALSRKYTNILDIQRQFNIDVLMRNPFAPSVISTTTTVWNLDHIYTAQTKDLQDLISMQTQTKPERVKGLFTSGLKWLLKLLAPALLDKAKEKIDDYTKPKAKGMMYNPPAITYAQDFELASNMSEDSDIEKNPGPTSTTIQISEDSGEDPL